MSRRRYISTEISIDRAVNRMGMEHGDFAVLLYTWMIPHAMDDATLTGDPFEILNMVFPGRRDKTEQDIITALEAMVEYGLIEWRDSRVMFHPDSFYKYQTYIKKENRRTTENAEERRETPNISEERRKSAENTVSLSLSPSLSLTHLHSKDDDDQSARPSKNLYDRIEGIMQVRLAKQNYRLVADEYHSAQDLVNEGFTEDEIFHGITYAFETQNPKSFKYCAEVIRTLRETMDGLKQTAAGGETNGRHTVYSRTITTERKPPANEYRRDKPGAF